MITIQYEKQNRKEPLTQHTKKVKMINERNGEDDSDSARGDRKLRRRKLRPLPWPKEQNKKRDDTDARLNNSKQVLRHLDIVAVRGIHYVEYAVGQPPQKVKLAVSMNSDFTIFRCSPTDDECSVKDCDSSNTFNKDNSNTFVKLGCAACEETDVCVNNRCLIQGQDWSAYRAKDNVIIADGSSFNLSFGCQVSSGNFLDKIEGTGHGILGLSSAETSFINQMKKANVLDSTTFSMCFRRYNNRNLSNAGVLTLGGYKNDFLTSPMVSFENTGINGKYSAVITNVYLRKSGGESVVPLSQEQKVVKLFFDKIAANSGPGTIIDSSSPYTLLNTSLLNSLKAEWLAMTGLPYPNAPISLTKEEILSLPTVLVQLKSNLLDNTIPDPDNIVGMVGTDLDPASPQDVILAIPAIHYMERQRDGKYKNMLSFDHKDGSVLGANAFQGRHLLFETGYRSPIESYIGIAETEKCSVDDIESDYDIADLSRSMSTSPSLSPNSIPTSQPVQRDMFQDGLTSWPILIGLGISILAVAIFIFWCYHKKQRRRKTDAHDTSESSEVESLNDDSASFVSFGLRTHLFSLVSSKGSIAQKYRSRNARHEGVNANETQQPRNDDPRGHEEVIGNLPLMGLSSQNQYRKRNERSNIVSGQHNMFQEPIVAQAHPIQSTRNSPDNMPMTAFAEAEPILAIPEANNNQHVPIRYNQQQQYQNIDRSLYNNDQNTEWNDQKTNRQPFLIKKGSAQSSDDENYTRYSREDSKRQLDMAVSRERAPYRPRSHHDDTRVARSRGRRHTMNMSSNNDNMDNYDKRQSGGSITAKREKRRSMDFPPQSNTNRSNSKSSEKRKKFSSRVAPSIRLSSTHNPNLQVDPITTTNVRTRTMPARGRRSSAISRDGSRRLSKHRSFKAAALSRAARTGIDPLKEKIPEIPAFRRSEDTSKSNGTVEGGTFLVGMRHHDSVISGLTDLGPRLSIGSAKSGSAKSGSGKSRISSDERSRRSRRQKNGGRTYSNDKNGMPNPSRRGSNRPSSFVISDLSDSMHDPAVSQHSSMPPVRRVSNDDSISRGGSRKSSVQSRTSSHRRKSNESAHIPRRPSTGRNTYSSKHSVSNDDSIFRGASRKSSVQSSTSSHRRKSNEGSHIPRRASIGTNTYSSKQSASNDDSIFRGASRKSSVQSSTSSHRRKSNEGSHKSRRASIGTNTYSSKQSSDSSGRDSVSNYDTASKYTTASRRGTGTSVQSYQSYDDSYISRDIQSSNHQPRRASIASSYASYNESDDSGGTSRQNLDMSLHSRRSSGESSRRSSRQQDHRRSMMMSTIKEVPSRNDTTFSDQSDSVHVSGIPRGRNSLQTFAKAHLDREMLNRNLPAAPQYRIMKQNSRKSMW